MFKIFNLFIIFRGLRGGERSLKVIELYSNRQRRVSLSWWTILIINFSVYLHSLPLTFPLSKFPDTAPSQSLMIQPNVSLWRLPLGLSPCFLATSPHVSWWRLPTIPRGVSLHLLAALPYMSQRFLAATSRVSSQRLGLFLCRSSPYFLATSYPRSLSFSLVPSQTSALFWCTVLVPIIVVWNCPHSLSFLWKRPRSLPFSRPSWFHSFIICPYSSRFFLAPSHFLCHFCLCSFHCRRFSSNSSRFYCVPSLFLITPSSFLVFLSHAANVAYSPLLITCVCSSRIHVYVSVPCTVSVSHGLSFSAASSLVPDIPPLFLAAQC